MLPMANTGGRAQAAEHLGTRHLAGLPDPSSQTLPQDCGEQAESLAEPRKGGTGRGPGQRPQKVTLHGV